MKIDAETLKKQVILHLPYILFLLVFAKLGEAVRLAPGADAPRARPAPHPELRRVPEQHGRRPGRDGHPVSELARRHGAREHSHGRLARHLGRRSLPRHPRREREDGTHLPAADRKPRKGGLLRISEYSIPHKMPKR